MTFPVIDIDIHSKPRKKLRTKDPTKTATEMSGAAAEIFKNTKSGSKEKYAA